MNCIDSDHEKSHQPTEAALSSLHVLEACIDSRLLYIISEEEFNAHCLSLLPVINQPNLQICGPSILQAPRRSESVFTDITAAINMSSHSSNSKLTVVMLRCVIPKLMMVLYLPPDQWQQREKGNSVSIISENGTVLVFKLK